MSAVPVVQQHLAAAPVACTNPQYFVLRDNKRVTGLRGGEGGKMGCGFPCKQTRLRGESCDASICLSASVSHCVVSSLFASISHSHLSFFLSPTFCLSLHLSLFLTNESRWGFSVA